MSAGALRSATSEFEAYRSIEQALGVTDFSNRLIHYTSVETLEAVLKSKSLYFGRITEMNDPSEFDHYIAGLLDVIHSLNLPGDVCAISEGIRLQAERVRNGTFSSSWCEYFESQPSGELEMWRTYGRNGCGLGLVIDSSEFVSSRLTPSKITFGINVSPVKYVPRANIRSEVNDTFRRLSNLPKLRLSPWANDMIVGILLAKAPCIKHDSYQAEREIRFLYYQGFREAFPGIFSPFEDQLASMSPEHSHRTFMALSLRNFPDYGFDLRIERLLKRVVVGSNLDSRPSTSRIRELLFDYGLTEVDVIESDIPMR